jgi:molybdopterin synthase catalytic subunit
MAVRLLSSAFDPWQELATYQAGQPGLAGKHGATAIFVGHMRDFNQGAAVRAMTLEHYPSMTQKQIERIGEQAAGRWELLDLLVIHRYGALAPGDPIVLVAVWATHRDAAFGACRYVIDELKTHAPFWKQEQTSSGQRWVAPETDG